MFTTEWTTSPREFEVAIERNFRIPVADGITLDSDLFRPDAPGKFPVILCAHPYNKQAQSTPMLPEGVSYRRAFIESGDFNFYVRRGYVMVIMNIRGTGASDGVFANRNPDEQTIRDIYDAIEWLAGQDWCDGNVGMMGVSYLSVVQKRVAALKPPHLKTIFAFYGWTEGYRDLFYHGGIFSHGFFSSWTRNRGPGMRIDKDLKAIMGEADYDAALASLRADRELMSVPFLAEVINDPETGLHPLVLEVLIHSLDDDWHRDRAVDFSDDDPIPAYFGADWGMFGFHMPGDMRAFKNWRDTRRMIMGPPIYLDRPVYQYAYESLRWFDYWLKGMDNQIMDEPAVKLFIVGANEWKTAEDWPVPGTRWTPFYLHPDGYLSEHECWTDDAVSSYADSAFERGGVEFATPPMVENTEICGPIVLNLYGSTTDTEVLWFASLWLIAEDGSRQMLTRGWLRGSQRALDDEKSEPWQPVHAHTSRDPLTPGDIYEFNIEIRPYGLLLKAGQKLGLVIKSADDEAPTNFNELLAHGHVARPNASRVTLHHNLKHPSHLLLPITRGNVVGTYFSGGNLPTVGPKMG